MTNAGCFTPTFQHSLAAVNFFLGIVGTIQVSRILMYQASQKDAVLPAIEEKVEEVKDAVKSS